jgi:hypothetical protein
LTRLAAPFDADAAAAARGVRNCQLGVALAIERATQGKVKAIEFLDECLEARRRYVKAGGRAA